MKWNNYARLFNTIGLSALLLTVLPVFAQMPQIEQTSILSPVTVTATRSERSTQEIPNAVSQFDRYPQQHFQPGITLDEFARNTPGVFFQNQANFTQDLRISIRGFGARSAFGVRGIQMYVDGIPQTLPDGQTQLDSIDPSLIKQMEIVRGPLASLYGNASGGMIGMTTREAPQERFMVSPRQVFGQYGLFKSELFAGGRHERLDYTVFGSHLQQNGWRDHSNVQNYFSQARLNFKISDDSDLMLLFRKFYSPEAKDPGSLTREQVRDDPRQASARNTQFNAGEEVNQEQMGIRFRKKPTSNQELSVTAHILHRDFQNRLPFFDGGQVQFDRLVGGVAMQYRHDHRLLDKPNRLIIGVDYGIQNDDRQRFNNADGRRGALTLNQIERVQNVGPFFRNEWRVHDKFNLVLGGRWDWLHFQVKDTYQADGNQSGDKTFSQGSGTAGLVYHLNQQHQIYTNIATIFETPTTTELINNPTGRGGFNSALKPQTSLSQELGLRGLIYGFQYESALFYIYSWDEILPFELPEAPGRAFFRNTGESSRLGVETRLATPEWRGLRGEASYTYSDFEFEKYTVDTISLKGNTFPGIPEHRWEGLLRYAHPFGFFGQFHVQHVGTFFVNDTNSVTNNAYTLGQLLFGWGARLRWLEGSIFAGINNLFDERYNANTRINAAFDRYFEPGAPVNMYGGIRLRITPF
ncbi:MAG: TonB-dependent receptor [Burkholderiales bacterium]|uniref:TonB-dependent receptor family protein n=1 Tax=Nitrosomonas sp. TaxID=42353 RepID=UPI001E0AF958|nr:TonB-dependent receptor [Nitrosomonas sp.]MCB1948541.1 TonB-dependent receptor [Nitrosomonas sp.]MCP5241920.1 TonB-dependent receptor [Burkholderiales bacterium]